MSEHEPQITVIGPDTRIKGEMSFDRTARILGHFEGLVTTEGELQIGASAHCKAALQAGTVIVDGLVEGDILARDRVQLNGSARVNGDVVAEKLIVSEGASFSGHCRVGPEAVANASAPQPKPMSTARPDHKPQIEAKPQATPHAVPETKPEFRPGGPKFDWVGQPVTTDANAKTGWGPTTRQPAEGAA